jgi:hypothetical protein
VLIGQTTGGLGNDSLSITNCFFRDSLSTPTTHINSTGSVSAPNSFNNISGNVFANFSANAINITATGNGDGWIIYNNQSYQTASRTTAISVILVSAGNGHLIRRNSIGGSAPDRSGIPFTNTAAFIRGIEVGGSNNTASLIDSNFISNIVTTGTAGVFGVYVNSGNANVNANVFGGLTNSWDTIQNGYDNGIITAVGGATVNITNNVIGNISYVKSGADRTSGIQISGVVSALSIRNNIIRDINHNGTGTATSLFRPTGIIINSAIANASITDNVIYNVNSTNTGASAYVVSGILISNISFVNNTIARNRIYNIGTFGTGNGASAPTAYGIQIISQGTGNRFLNNQIMLGNTASGQTFVAGIRDESTSAEALYFNNSVLINGVNSGGTNNSYCLQRTSTSNMVLRNNILYNNRRTLGVGFNYAVGASSVAGISINTLRNNLIIVTDTSRVSEYPTGVGYGVFAYNNTLFNPSFNPEWIESAVNLNAADLFIDTINADLGIDISKPSCWYANGKGMPIAGFSGDFNNAAGVRSTSISGGPVDIGSVEFSTLTTPPIASADKSPVLSDSTQFTFAGRLVGKIVWNTGTLPSNVEFRLFSGVLPANLPVNASRIHGYYNINTNNVSGFNATLTLHFDSSMLGNINNALRARTARYTGSATTWFGYNTLSVNSGLAMVTSANVGHGGIFCISDSAVNPLPVALSYFKGKAAGKNAELFWNTASELNNSGFYIERSMDGEQFATLDFVAGKGNSNVPVSYSYTDNNAFEYAAIIYYRLRQVDLDGATNYSNMVVLNKNHQAIQQLNVYPNPATVQSTIEFIANTGTAKIELKDINGRTIYCTTAATTNGLNSLRLDNLNEMDAGIYFIKVMVADEVQVLKLIKQ